MKYITSILFLLFFSGATAQHKRLENRLYYQQVDSVELYGAGHYQIKLSVVKFSHLLTADEMKKTAQKFAYQNHFSDSIPKVNPRVKNLITMWGITKKLTRIIGTIRCVIFSMI